MMLARAGGNRSPWPGPIPYKEEDAKRFFGRSIEVQKLLTLVGRQRLSILTALSGVGKSSLLQAGLVPALRMMRERGRSVGPTLVLRGWGHLAGLSPTNMLIEALGDEIARLSDWSAESPMSRLHQDMLAVQNIGHVSSLAQEPLDILLEYVRAICDAVGSVVLIIDQLEELLGSGFGRPNPDRERSALGAIGIIYQEEPRAILLLSLREEYRGRLKPLEIYVGGLEKRVLPLDPMPLATTRKVIIDSAEIAGYVSMRPSELDTILGWLRQHEDLDSGAEEERSVDLLRLQALLVYIFEWVKDRSAEGDAKDEIAITEGVLDDFRRNHDEKDLAEHALRYYIEKTLDSSDDAEFGSKAMPRDNRRDLVRRIAVRMARWLSSPGGFKRHVEEGDLILNSLRDDFAILELASGEEEVRAALSTLRRVGSADLENLQFNDSIQGDIRLSGLSSQWTLVETATMLVRASFRALDILEREEVLKSGQWRGRTSWELVHDGFGPALLRWAEAEQATLRDTLASLVSRRGETFRWREAGGLEGEHFVFSDLCWLGCNLKNVRFQKVKFVNCNLRGTIFTDCIFIDCRFVGCNLDGSVFKGGLWEGVRWEKCDGASALLLGLEWLTVDFVACVIPGATVSAISLKGPVCVQNSRLCFCQIERFERNSDAFLSFTGCDLRNSLFQEGEEDWIKWSACKRSGLVPELPGLEEIPRAESKG